MAKCKALTGSAVKGLIVVIYGRLGMFTAAGIKQVVHHGIIREDASDNTEVKLDVPLGTDSIRGLNGSKYTLCACVVMSDNTRQPFSNVVAQRRIWGGWL